MTPSASAKCCCKSWNKSISQLPVSCVINSVVLYRFAKTVHILFGEVSTLLQIYIATPRPTDDVPCDFPLRLFVISNLRIANRRSKRGPENPYHPSHDPPNIESTTSMLSTILLPTCTFQPALAHLGGIGTHEIQPTNAMWCLHHNGLEGSTPPDRRSLQAIGSCDRHSFDQSTG